MKLHETKTYQRIRTWTKRYEKFWIPLMLLGGLSGDIIQYSALNIEEKFIVQGVYLLVSTSALILIHYPREIENRMLRGVRLAAPFLHQFAVGGLLSTSLLFYWFSGDVSVSWPILLLVAIFMLSNEFLREHFLRPTVQIGVLSFSLFSLSSILFSFVFNSLDPLVFIAAGIASFMFMLAYASLYLRLTKTFSSIKPMFITIVSVLGLMILCYFLNIIPPIPLSIRDAGIYHLVSRVNGDYVLAGEDESWIQKILPGQTLHVSPTDSLYAYTAIFAPAELSTTIIHKWQYFDESTHAWITGAIISYPITGGREEGYRGYSKKSHLAPGSWRVSVETERGQVLGRIHFKVVNE